VKQFKKYSLLVLIFLLGLNSLKPDLFEQLSRLPFLIGHYKHHTIEEKEDISFITFLKLHYDEDSKHKSEENHDDLPLFTHCFSHYHVLVIEELQALGFHTLSDVPKPEDSYRFHYSFTKLAVIFQPPRNA
jgi:hypothetical protein